MESRMARIISEKGYLSLYDLLCMNLNHKAKIEVSLYHYNTVDRIMKLMGPYIDETKVNGRILRSTRREMMKQILAIFYRYLFESPYAQVSPSQLTIAYIIDPSLRAEKTDDEETLERKRKAAHKLEVAVQRAIISLQQMGLIRVVQYYKNAEHLNSFKNPCFFYIITPPSTFFPKTFAEAKTLKANRRPVRTKLIKSLNAMKEESKPVVYISYLDDPYQPDAEILEILQDEKVQRKRARFDAYLKKYHPERFNQLQEERRIKSLEMVQLQKTPTPAPSIAKMLRRGKTQGVK